MTTILHSGDRAPELSLLDAHGERHELGATGTQGTIIYFYPRAGTPGCTTEACDFRDNLASLGAEGYTVWGVSPDDAEALQGFEGEHGLGYPLLSDPDAVVARRWGAWGVSAARPEAGEGILRSTFVLDPRGVILIADYDVAATGHVGALRERLRTI